MINIINIVMITCTLRFFPPSPKRYVTRASRLSVQKLLLKARRQLLVGHLRLVCTMWDDGNNTNRDQAAELKDFGNETVIFLSKVGTVVNT